MENPEKLTENIENSTESKNEWEEMAAEAPEFNKETAANEVREQIVNQFENSKTFIERFDGLQKLLNTGNVEGYERKIDKTIIDYRKKLWLYSDQEKINKRQLHKIKATLDAYDRYISKTLNGENPEQPTKEKPGVKERVTAVTNTDSSIKVLDYKKDQEEIIIIKSFSPETKKSLDSVVEYCKEHPYVYVPNTTATSSKQPEKNNKDEEPKPQEIAGLPDQGLNPYHNLSGDWPFYGPFNNGQF